MIPAETAPLPAPARHPARRAWLRPVPVVLGLSLLIVRPPASRAPAKQDRSSALAAELSHRGLLARASDVHWVREASSAVGSRFADASAVVLAQRPRERADVYLVAARLSPEGALLEVGSAYNLTRTSAVSESHLVAARGHAAWSVGSAERVLRVELADVGLEDIPEASSWTRLARAQHALTNWQRTGSPGGVGRRSFRLDPAASRVTLAADEPRLRVVADDHAVGIPWRRGGPIENERFVREEDRELASPGNFVTWAVDRARDTSWVGDERMQLTKAIAYAALDRLERAVGAVRPPQVEEAAADELGAAAPAAAVTDPEAGWPPPPAKPLLTPPADDEGKWLSLENDPFVHVNPGAPTPMVTTYLRAEGNRPEARVVIIAWDTRQVELDVVPGTEEPQSATGETGNGMLPRDPRVLGRLLAAFNGGFQSTHGDFGMQSGGVLLVPPKPFAATVGRTRDGTAVFGTWPRELAIPADFVSFRQNLTPLVEGGRLNPWNRSWWGGVPHDWEDETRTVRSGLCFAKHGGYAAYLYGTKVDHERLGRAMLAVGCDYGLHLDMNQGHTGIELYRVFPEGSLPKLPGKASGKLDGQWQAEGPVLGLPGYTFRGRKLTRNMSLMHFPRYIRRGARDYFYLTLKSALPGRTLVPGAPPDVAGAEGAWTAADVPAGRFPQSVVTTSLRPDPARPETKVHVVKFDPDTVAVAGADDAAQPAVLSLARASGGALTLWLDARRAIVAGDRPHPAAVALVTGEAKPAEVRAGACVDDDGMVVFAEVATAADPPHDGALLDLAFDAARCGPRVYLTTPLALALAGDRDLSGHPVRARTGAIRLVRTTSPHARRVFADTKVLTPAEWMPLQRQTRYFPKPDLAPPSPSSEPPSTDP